MPILLNHAKRAKKKTLPVNKNKKLNRKNQTIIHPLSSLEEDALADKIIFLLKDKTLDLPMILADHCDEEKLEHIAQLLGIPIDQDEYALDKDYILSFLKKALKKIINLMKKRKKMLAYDDLLRHLSASPRYTHSITTQEYIKKMHEILKFEESASHILVLSTFGAKTRS